MEQNSSIFKFKLSARTRAFIISFIAVFLMSSLPKLGVHTPQIISPLPSAQQLPKPDQFLETVRPKLQEKINDFSLNKPTSFVGEVSAASGDFDQLNAYAVVDFDSGEILLDKNLDKSLPIASVTKIMTAAVAFDLLEKDELLTVSEHAAGIIPTKMGVVPGQQWSTEEMVTALLLTSANDAAEVLKEGVDAKYGEGTFIKAMNEKARFLKLKNSSFTNPQGFDNRNHFSSVGDLAVLSNYALKSYPEIGEIVNKEYQFYPATKTHKQADLYNWNGLLGVYPGSYGIKIGNTGDAKYTTTVVSEREGRHLFVVSLGAPGVLERDLWSAQLLDLGFQKVGINAANITEEQLRAKYQSWKYF